MAKTKPAKPKPGVTVRMYCQGLGDCFLLSFPRDGGGRKRAYVMIDCGVIIGTQSPSAKMAQVVADIAATVKATNENTAIDLLVVTHEHWDHVSGFVQAADAIGKLRFHHVWLAWTEQEGHPVADRLRAEQKKKLKKLRAALAKLAPMLGAAGLDSEAGRVREEVEAAQQVLDFFGPDSDDRQALAAAGLPADKKAAGSTEAAMDWLKERATRYCEPGERLAVPGAAGVTAYVLGPPTDTKLLHKDAPSKGKDEAYELMADRVSLLGALEWAAGLDDAREPESPFDDKHRVAPQDARLDPFFREFYGFADDPLGDDGSAWRRIDHEWITGASQLALKLDSDTNNTSLALAFELADGRTLIFPGDAQIGNWQSWQAVDFKRPDKSRVTAADLLARAVFYKVGHHGSHNATLKEGGLEAMTSGELVAMIPVDEKMAKRKRPPKDGWKMPFQPLDRRLKELTAGRVLRADQGEVELQKERDAVRPASARRWDAFRRQVAFAGKPLVQDPNDADADKGRRLYVEYTVPVSG